MEGITNHLEGDVATKTNDEIPQAIDSAGSSGPDNSIEPDNQNKNDKSPSKTSPTSPKTIITQVKEIVHAEDIVKTTHDLAEKVIDTTCDIVEKVKVTVPVEHISKTTDQLVGKPKLHQKFEIVNGIMVNTSDISEERHPSWLELIFDIIIVIMAEKLVHGFGEDVGHTSKVTAPFLYAMKVLIVLQIWQGVDGYLNRFGHSESFADTLFIVLQFLVIICASATVQYQTSENHHEKLQAISGFALAIAFSDFIFLMMYTRLYILLKDAQGYIIFLLWHYFTTLFLWLLAAFCDVHPWQKWLFFGAASLWELVDFHLVEFIQPILIKLFRISQTTLRYVPINVRLSIERNGLLIVIAIGEVISTVISGDSLSAPIFGRAIIAVLLGFIYKFMYFDVFHTIGAGLHTVKHAMQISKLRGFTYMRLQFVIVGAILITKYYMTTDEFGYLHSEHKIYSQMVFSIAVAIITMGCYFGGLLHRYEKGYFSRQLIPRSFRSVLYFLCSCAMIIVAGCVEFDDGYKLIGIDLSLATFCLFFEFLCTWYIVRTTPKTSDTPSNESPEPEEKVIGEVGIDVGDDIELKEVAGSHPVSAVETGAIDPLKQPNANDSKVDATIKNSDHHYRHFSISNYASMMARRIDVRNYSHSGIDDGEETKLCVIQ